MRTNTTNNTQPTPLLDRLRAAALRERDPKMKRWLLGFLTGDRPVKVMAAKVRG